MSIRRYEIILNKIKNIRVKTIQAHKVAKNTKVSTEGSLRTKAFFWAMRRVPTK